MKVSIYLHFLILQAITHLIRTQSLATSEFFEASEYFDPQLFISYNPVGTTAKVCLAAENGITPEKCVNRVINSNKIFFSPCQDDQICQVIGDYSGTCNKKALRPTLTYLYPGDVCSEDPRSTSKCAYGQQRCASSICVGLDDGSPCEKTEDCNAGSYCDTKGLCSKEKKIGEDCLADEECGRQAACHFTDPFSFFGRCTEFFTIEKGASTIVFNRFEGGKSIKKGKFSDLFCKSGISAVNGTCIDGYTSYQELGFCQQNADCIAKEDPGIFSDCECSLNPLGKKMCALHKGDSRWNDSIVAVSLLAQI